MQEKELDKKRHPEMSQHDSIEPCCSMQSIVPIDGRGQIVLPKDIRERAALRAGDKLAVISHVSGGEVCCISLIKIDRFSGAVNRIMEPFLKGTGKNEGKETG